MKITVKDIVTNVLIAAVYVVFMILKRRPSFFESIRAKQNLEFKW